jgi:hypothetical protein
VIEIRQAQHVLGRAALGSRFLWHWARSPEPPRNDRPVDGNLAGIPFSRNSDQIGERHSSEKPTRTSKWKVAHRKSVNTSAFSRINGRPQYTCHVMKRRIYLSIEFFSRLLAAAGGLWILILLMATAAWATSHMVRWWICAVVDASSTVCLLAGAIAVRWNHWLLIVFTCCGALGVASLGLLSMLTQGEHSSASLLFALTFFALTVSMPVCVVALCVYDFRRTYRRYDSVL